MPKVAQQDTREERIHLTTSQWDDVLSMVEAVARKIPPTNTRGRRCWFKYAVLARVKFNEAWLMDAVAGVFAGKTSGTIQGHFVSIPDLFHPNRDISLQCFATGGSAL
jgi:hypothetical protein